MLRRRTNKSPGNLIVRWPIADSAMLGGQTPGHRPWSTSPYLQTSALSASAVTAMSHYCHCMLDKAVVDIRLRSRLGAALRWVNFYSRNAMLTGVLAVARYLSVTVSVTRRRSNWSSWFLHGGLLTTCATLRFKEIQVSAKIRVLRSETLSQIPDFEISPRHISIVKTCYQLTI